MDAQTIEVCDSLQVVCKPVKVRIRELITMSVIFLRRNFLEELWERSDEKPLNRSVQHLYVCATTNP